MIHQLIAYLKILEPYHIQRIDKDGNVFAVWLTATALENEAGKMYAIANIGLAMGVKIKEL